ncbi:hypothetical protein [Desertibacillus haloalkaliphilus]|uniref:hypothetical protein n=1 Tax=Desertibacillus haloalkaliphilus TaxID=1328930 RepID=UPI001C27EB6F|nr:hypothetical protein [Desertibacillus haloalkaliphilus]MBU8905555.1 hypothetical protein [Desertibacillus haloalkaliphilus]
MRDVIRGVSVHTTGDGLQYYIHFDQDGTKLVSQREYEEAVRTLNEWKEIVEQKNKEATLVHL